MRARVELLRGARRHRQVLTWDGMSELPAWLRLALATSSAAGYSVIPDVDISRGYLAQPDDDRKPATGTSNNFPIATFDASGDVMIWPLNAAHNNGAQRVGFFFWVRPTDVASTQTVLSIGLGAGGASAAKILVELVNATIRVRVNVDASNVRQAVTGNVLTAGAWHGITIEYDGTKSTEATRCVVTLAGRVQTLSFSDSSGSTSGMPTNLVVPSGNALVGGFADADSGTNPFVGDMGANFLALPFESSATEGMITHETRMRLCDFEPPAENLFSPLAVPEVAAGRLWEPDANTNLGATNFRNLNRGAGGTTWDLLQTTVAKQPSQIINNGFTQWRFTGSVSGGQACMSTQVDPGAMGWTGATMWSYWGRLPNGWTGTTQWFRHNASGTKRRALVPLVNTNTQRLQTSSDGNGLQGDVRWNFPAGLTAEWHYWEWLYDPSLALNDRLLLYVDRQFRSPQSVTPHSGSILFNANSRFDLCNVNAVANADTTEIGPFFYTNGIPSASDRDRMYRYKAPVPGITAPGPST